MKTIMRTLIIALMTVAGTLQAQDFQGVATYKTQRKFEIKMDSTKVNDAMQTKMMEMMKKQFQKTYKLSFNREASVYKEEESLSKPQVGSGMSIQMVGSGGGSDVLYKNTKENRYVDHKDAMGKLFLVKDVIKPIEWKLESESKFIGEYQCYKATYTKMIEKRDFSFDSGSKNNDEPEEEKEPEMEERVITAWYTPQIPVNNGPAMYQGLPGLILEVHDGKLTVICSKIVLNPEDKVEIKEPEKGKKVNQEKYDEIMEKKAKEMMERFRPKKGDRKGDGYTITIGG